MLTAIQRKLGNVNEPVKGVSVCLETGNVPPDGSLLGNKGPGESEATTEVVATVAMTLSKKRAVAAEVRHKNKQNMIFMNLPR